MTQSDFGQKRFYEKEKLPQQPTGTSGSAVTSLRQQCAMASKSRRAHHVVAVLLRMS